MARCTKIINPNTEEAKYVINVKQIAKVFEHTYSSFNNECKYVKKRECKYVFMNVGWNLNYFYALQFVVGLGDKVSPTDIEEGMRVGYVILFRFSNCGL